MADSKSARQTSKLRMALATRIRKSKLWMRSIWSALSVMKHLVMTSVLQVRALLFLFTRSLSLTFGPIQLALILIVSFKGDFLYLIFLTVI